VKRSGDLRRMTPLARGTGLPRSRTRRKPRAAGSLDNLTAEAIAAAVAAVLAGTSTVAQAAREAGADPDAVETLAWDRAKQLTRERDGGLCLACGRLADDVHHRQRRGMGGTDDPVIAFGLVNLVCLCRMHHDLCHRYKDTDAGQHMRAHGYWLETWEDPALTPLLIVSEHGSGMRVWLSAAGPYLIDAPEGAAA
jgi:hypothetical protein